MKTLFGVHAQVSFCFLTYWYVRVPFGATRRSFEIKKTDARARLPVMIMTRPESTLLPSPVPPPQPCCTLILTTGFSLSTVTLFASTVFSETEKGRRARPSAQMPRGRRSRGQATLYGHPRHSCDSGWENKGGSQQLAPSWQRTLYIHV